MDARICKICGGKIIIGPDGVGTCESCGTIYSVDSLRGTEQNGGRSVQVDDTNQIPVWDKLGWEAISNNDYSKAEEYFTKIIAADSNNYKAILKRGEVEVELGRSAGVDRSYDLYSAMVKALEILDAVDMPEEEKQTTKFSIFIHTVYDLESNGLRYVQEKIDNIHSEIDKLHFPELYGSLSVEDVNRLQLPDTLLSDPSHSEEMLNVSLETAEKHYIEDCKRILDAKDKYYPCGAEYVKVLPQIDSYDLKNYFQSILTAYSGLCSTEYEKAAPLTLDAKKPYLERYLAIVDELLPYVEEGPSEYQYPDPFEKGEDESHSSRQQTIKEYWDSKRRGKYWSQHTDEKQRLDLRLAEIKGKETELNNILSTCLQDIDSIQAELQKKQTKENQVVNDKQSQIDILQQQLNQASGIFAGRQKKTLNGQIEQLQTELQEAQVKCEQAIRNFTKTAEEQLKPLQEKQRQAEAQLKDLQEEEKNINSELDKVC